MHRNTRKDLEWLIWQSGNLDRLRGAKVSIENPENRRNAARLVGIEIPLILRRGFAYDLVGLACGRSCPLWLRDGGNFRNAIGNCALDADEGGDRKLAGAVVARGP